MFQLQTELGETMPVSIVLLTDGQHGRVAFIKTAQFKAIVEEGAVFDWEGFTIGGEEFQYNSIIDYKNIPALLKWLQKQNLQWPENFTV